jgi:hypothetical protein
VTYAALPARLVAVVAHQPVITAMWDGCERIGRLHVARHRPSDPTPVDQPIPDMPELVRGWDGACEYCGDPIPWDSDDVHLGGGLWSIYDTASGKLEPGCLWFDDHAGRECFHWGNCDGRHLHAMLPNGAYWDIDGRANNCSLPDDRTHRCWVRVGEPPAVTAGKAGHTCSAGAGSILAGDYHGFLINGEFSAG